MRIAVLNLDSIRSIMDISNESRGEAPWLCGIYNSHEDYSVDLLDDYTVDTTEYDIVVIPIYYAPWMSNETFCYTSGIYEALPESVKSLIQEDNVFVLFDNVHEGETKEFFEVAYSYLHAKPFRMERVIYNTSSLTLFDDHEHYCTENKITKRMKVIGSSLWEDMSNYFDTHDYKIDPLRYTNREKKYLNLNRRLRSHRPAFVSMLASRNLLEHGKVSLFTKDDGEAKVENYKHCKLYYRGLGMEIEHGFNLIKDKLPMVVDKTDGTINYAVDPDMTNLYITTYFSLVSCTFFYSDYKTVQMNEKIFKPIAYKQPFVIIGTPNTLKYLRDYGFKTFDGIIDETYDTIEDDTKRALAILQEVERLSNMSNDAWDKTLKEMLPILEHNQNRLLDFSQSEKYNKIWDAFK